MPLGSSELEGGVNFLSVLHPNSYSATLITLYWFDNDSPAYAFESGDSSATLATLN